MTAQVVDSSFERVNEPQRGLRPRIGPVVTDRGFYVGRGERCQRDPGRQLSVIAPSLFA